MAVRAKFRCHSITLTQQSRIKEGYTYDHEKRKYVTEGGKESANAAELYENWDQPTVQLYAVTPGTTDENAQFFAATPSAECKVTISNPEAAEFFELGKEYYLDFSRAS